MSDNKTDLSYLWDMREACHEIQEFTVECEWEDFINDRKCVLAVERCLEIIGEAANSTSESFRHDHPQIAWRKIRGMRNILAHDYGRIDHAIIYQTVLTEIPDLLQALENLLPGDPE